MQRGERVGVLTVRLFRPFAVADFAAALPPTARAIAVLDRTKEPGAVGDPLYLDVVTACAKRARRRSSETVVVGGRYGLGSKEFTPGNGCARCSTSWRTRRRRITSRSALVDDRTHTSLAVDPEFDIEPDDASVRCSSARLRRNRRRD